jgi:hypothetical protein
MDRRMEKRSKFWREVSVLDTETKDLTDSILLIRAEMRQIRKQSDEKVTKSDAEREVVQRQLELSSKNLIEANVDISNLRTADVRANSYKSKTNIYKSSSKSLNAKTRI